MGTHMTWAAWQRGMKNSLLMACVVTPVVVVAGLIVFQFDSADPINSLLSASSGLLALTLIFMAFAWLRSRRRAGRVLVDCGPRAGRKLFVCCTFLFLLNAIVPAILQGWSLFTLTNALIAVLYIVMTLSRLQVREAGIWFDHGLLPWEQIKSYAWDDGSPNHPSATLRLTSTSRIPFWGNGAMPISEEYKVAVYQLLRNHVGPDAAAQIHLPPGATDLELR